MRSIAIALRASRRSRWNTFTCTLAAKQSWARSKIPCQILAHREGNQTHKCEANRPCTSAGDAARGLGTGARAGRQRCQTAGAGCTADRRPEHRRAIRTRSNTDATRRKLLRCAARFRAGARNESPCKKSLIANGFILCLGLILQFR
jgi:hypothetical protein